MMLKKEPFARSIHPRSIHPGSINPVRSIRDPTGVRAKDGLPRLTRTKEDLSPPI